MTVEREVLSMGTASEEVIQLVLIDREMGVALAVNLNPPHLMSGSAWVEPLNVHLERGPEEGHECHLLGYCEVSFHALLRVKQQRQELIQAGITYSREQPEGVWKLLEQELEGLLVWVKKRRQS